MDKLEHYLLTGPEQVDDIIKWWTECSAEYPCLSRMALDYLSIPGMSLGVLN
jgi:esterase/lipase